MTFARLASLRVLAVSALVLSSSCAFAQQSPVSNTARVRGTVESLDGEKLLVKSRDGADVMLHLPQNAGVAGVAKMSLVDVKVGSYIGVTSVPDSGGNQKAVEVHVFPEAMRGTGDGDRPWGSSRNAPRSRIWAQPAAGALEIAPNPPGISADFRPAKSDG